MTHDKTKYAIGSVVNHVLLHQSVVGQEAVEQMKMFEAEPDYVVGCIGGGSNYAGLAYPFMREKLRGKSEAEFVAVEPKAVPSTTRGEYRYDFGDTGEMTPLFKMYTVGHTYQCPPIHGGGLRYHGKAPSMSMLIDKGYMRSVAYNQNEAMDAAITFARTEGIVVAPETSHAVKGAIDIALQCKQKNEAKIILFNLSGHGLLDLKAYEDKLSRETRGLLAHRCHNQRIARHGARRQVAPTAGDGGSCSAGTTIINGGEGVAAKMADIVYKPYDEIVDPRDQGDGDQGTHGGARRVADRSGPDRLDPGGQLGRRDSILYR